MTTCTADDSLAASGPRGTPEIYFIHSSPYVVLFYLARILCLRTLFPMSSVAGVIERLYNFLGHYMRLYGRRGRQGFVCLYFHRAPVVWQKHLDERSKHGSPTTSPEQMFATAEASHWRAYPEKIKWKCIARTAGEDYWWFTVGDRGFWWACKRGMQTLGAVNCDEFSLTRPTGYNP
jgi:hypothetical protein